MSRSFSDPAERAKPTARGYDTRLPRWFRSRQWLGRMDLRVAGNPDNSSPRELGTAIVLDDRIQWPDSIPGRTLNGKVLRRVPSSLDVLCSVFDNDAIVPCLAARMEATTGVPFRDGYPYAHNLEAVRRVFDAQPGEAWTASVHTHWLGALRALSQPTTGSEFPHALRTRAWAMKQAQGQMASWAQLRHDNIAHVKESYTPDILCEYPDGFVEPVLPFWRSLQTLANRTADVIEPLPFTGTVWFQFGTISQEWSKTNLLARHAAFLRQFARTMDQLAAISSRELAGEPLASTETAFLQNLIEWMFSYFGVRSFTGWYPGLFYVPLGHGLGNPVLHRSDQWDPVIASVHTAVPASVVGDLGTVVHEAVGNVALLLIAADNGPDRTVYAGPAFTAYEILPAGIQRWTDEQWKARLLSGPLPEIPEWLDQTLVPSLIPISAYAQ